MTQAINYLQKLKQELSLSFSSLLFFGFLDLQHFLHNLLFFHKKSSNDSADNITSSLTTTTPKKKINQKADGLRNAKTSLGQPPQKEHHHKRDSLSYSSCLV